MWLVACVGRGLEPQIRSIIEAAPAHQTMMFTATWPREVQKLAREFLKDPIQVNIGATDTLNVNVDITPVRRLSAS